MHQMGTMKLSHVRMLAKDENFNSSIGWGMGCIFLVKTSDVPIKIILERLTTIVGISVGSRSRCVWVRLWSQKT